MGPIRESQESKEEREEVGEERPSLQHSELEVLHSCIHVFRVVCESKEKQGNLLLAVTNATR